ncbi:HAMP domain-containing sensor histidine kinase [Algivirga pacifica]|uniref:histidine kinase n=1 Tax=Algivirga pacifica TaxID=1162670 RepID=A0ABP9DGY6_9BACT
MAAFLTDKLIQQENNHEEFAAQVQRNLHDVSDKMRDGILDVKQSIKREGQVNFTALLEDTSSEGYGISYYVFNNNEQIVFWSDHNVNVRYEDIKGYYLERCIRIGSALYLVRKSSFRHYDDAYDIVALLPLFYDFQVNNLYLPKGPHPRIFLSSKDVGITVLSEEAEGYPILTKTRKYLFTLTMDKGTYFNRFLNWTVMLLSLTGFALLIWELIKLGLHLTRNKHYWRTFLGLFMLLALLKFSFSWWDWPYEQMHLEVFKPAKWSLLSMSSTAAGTVLNQLFLLVLIIYVSRSFNYLIPVRKVMLLSSVQKQVLGGTLVFSTFAVAYYLAYIQLDFFKQSGLTFSVYDSILDNSLYILGISLLLINVAIYYWVCHLASKLMLKTLPLASIMVTLGVGTLIYFIFLLLFQESTSMVVFNINAIYFAGITFLGLPKRIVFGDYTIFFYILSCAAAFAMMGTYTCYEYKQTEYINAMRDFASELQDNEEMIGFRLEEAVEEIRNDRNLPKYFIEQNVGNWERDRLMEKLFFNKYFEKYDISVSFYNSLKLPIGGGVEPLQKEVQPFMNSQAERIRNYIFAKHDQVSGNKSYICVVPVYERGEPREVGYVLVKLKAKRFSYGNAHHFFLKNGKISAWQKEFSYAIYFRRELVYSFGEYNYANALLETFRYDDNPHLLRLQLKHDGYNHIRKPDGIDKHIIVSVPDQPLSTLYADFSFLFLLLMFVFLTTYTLNNYMSKPKEYEVNFSTKIQLYLNVAFFMPIIVVGIVVVTVMSSQNSEEQRNIYYDKAQSVATSLQEDVLKYHQGEISKRDLENKIYDISGVVQSDIHFFDEEGFLVGSSDDYLFEISLLSKTIHPEAYAGIKESKRDKIMLSEHVGALSYNTVYIGIKEYKGGKVLGFFSIPFFRSAYKLDRQVLEVLSTVLQVFTVVLLLLLPFLFLVSMSLLKPLKLIRAKISNVSLNHSNEIVDYHVRDEFGLLIGAYNQMLANLEESKKALAQTEKESAWRDMAQQVAHEIKNPLTPMRLTLQQLQRVLSGQEDHRVERSLNMMLNQVDTLADIATSFSTYASMPLPKEEEFDVAKVLRQTAILFKSKNEAEIVENIPDGAYYVRGDKQLMGRIFSNLVINGIQAVDEGGQPRIALSLRVNMAGKVQIEVSDNGGGIPEDIQQKVFTPKFTTKSTGSGIGLAISKRGVEHSGGSIWFETEEGVGTSFFVEMELLKLGDIDFRKSVINNN